MCSVLFKLIPLVSEPKFKEAQSILQQTICSLLPLLYGYPSLFISSFLSLFILLDIGEI